MINISIRQLEVFVEIGRQGNLTKASEILGMTQSAASMSLKELELHLGGELFNRVGRGLSLNNFGRVLYFKAEHIIGEVQELMSFSTPTDELCGEVIVGCSTTIATYDFPKRIQAIKKKYPRLEVTLRVGNTDEIAASVKSGELDFGLVEGEVLDSSLICSNWVRDELVFISSKDDELSNRKRVSLRSLKDENWILRERGSGTLSTLERALHDQGIELGHRQIMGHTEAIKRAVEAGMGISCLSKIAVRREIKAGHLNQIPVTGKVDRWFQLVQYRGRYQSRIVKEVIELLFK